MESPISSHAITTHRVIFGNCIDMHETARDSVQLTVTSPPYYNAPFDYPGMYRDYEEYLGMLSKVADELFRVTTDGRIACFVIDDMLVDGEKLPIVADAIRIMRQTGFRYRDRIMWVKPKGYSRISRRSGVVIQHPYPMYFYPDNIQESILIFQKGRFDYSRVREMDPEILEASKIDSQTLNANEWNLTVWPITNVLPTNNPLEKGIAAFPEELASRLVQLFSFVGETVLDPFLGSGTTSKVCALLGRNSVGYELNQSLKDRIYTKINAAGRVKLRSEKRHDSVPEFEMEEVPSGRRSLRQSLR
ncbi:MAG: site-specific DNA-methyltransferase [Thaumarchaeota archaeon]|nr:site-specific DNA-methyltransferase [Nitrososphaerota archaeon]